MQTKEELEIFYQENDPWEYQSNIWDKARRDIIVTTAKRYHPIGGKTLDLGCGEGWVTKKLPGALYGVELSDIAASRLHDSITRLKDPSGKFHTVLACGVLYEQYDWRQFHRWIERCIAPGGHVITCNIMEWEINELPRDLMIEARVFPYREFNQILRIYKW